MPTVRIDWEGRGYLAESLKEDLLQAIKIVGVNTSPIFYEHIDVGFAITDDHEDNLAIILRHGSIRGVQDLGECDPEYELRMAEDWDTVLDATNADESPEHEGVIQDIKKYIRDHQRR